MNDIKVMVRNNMMAMDQRSHVMGQDTTSANMMVMLTRASKEFRGKMPRKIRMKKINSWLW